MARAKATLSDVLAPDLRIVFCGINPGRQSAAAGAHYANPRNDFWRLLHASKLTPRQLAPAEQAGVVDLGLGLTNAVARMTPGSGDLRRADFAGAAARLEKIARELRPRWIGFVGKVAYEGTFGERAELGLQSRRLGATQLFVLPSTSPANAAVPWLERARWFDGFAGRASGLPLRPAARGLVVDSRKRVLLVKFEFPRVTIWALPGGGIAPDESIEQALVRELDEEVGIRVPIGAPLWTRTHWFLGMGGYAGQRETAHLVRLPARYRPAAPSMSSAELAAEHLIGQRWWTPAELDATDALFSPRRLPALVHELLVHGPPAAPIDAGV